MKFTPAFIVLLCLSGMSCSHQLGSIYKEGYVKHTADPQVPDSFYKENSCTLHTSAGVSAKVLYLGSGGFLIKSASGDVLIDPFFSHKHFWCVPFTRLRVKTRVIRKELARDSAAIHDNVEAVLVTHSHYDHLLDVPYVFNRYCNRSKASVVTSHSGERLIGTVVPRANILDAEDKVWTSKNPGGVFEFNGGAIRVYPIRSDHAPHWRHIKLYDGEARPMKRYDRPAKKTWACRWKGGVTFSYLIDIHPPAGNDFLRIYVQSSAAAPPNGFLPQSLLDEHPVNLALLGAASFAYTDHYPEELVQHLKPERVVICHWEDFFLRYERKHKRIVRFTNLGEFVHRLNTVYPWEDAGVKDRFILPKPGTNIIVD